MSSRKISLPAWNLLLCERQKLSNNHSARTPITPDQQGLHEMREEVLLSARANDMDTSGFELSDIDDILLSARANDMDTSGFELSDIDDIEFFWVNPPMELNYVFRPVIDTPFSWKAFENLELLRSPFYSTTGITKKIATNNSNLWETQLTPCVAAPSALELELKFFLILYGRILLQKVALWKYFDIKRIETVSLYYHLPHKTVTHVWDRTVLVSLSIFF